MHEAEFLAGPAEIAEALGVDANTVNQWKIRHNDFPKPVRELKGGSIWDIREVRAWAVATGRITIEPDVSQGPWSPPVQDGPGGLEPGIRHRPDGDSGRDQ